MSRSFRLVLFVVMELAVARIGVASGADARQRFLEEAPRAWRELEKSYGEYQGLIGLVSGHPGSSAWEVATDKSRAQTSYEFAICGKEGMVITTDLAGKRRRVVGSNADYEFELRQDNDAKEWVVTDVDFGPAADNKESRVREHAHALYVATHVDGLSLADIVESSSFKLNKVTADGDLIDVSFECDIPEDEHNILRGGNVTFDPKSYWAVQRFELSLQSTSEGTTRGIVRYIQGEDGVPVPVEFVQDYSFPPTDFWRYVYAFNGVKRCTENEAHFRLSGFGLPEPQRLANRSRRNWLIGANALAILLLIFAVYLKKRAGA